MPKKREKEDISLDEKINKMQIPKEEEPYKIPNNWVWTRLKNVSDKITDGAHKTPTYTESGIPFISVKDIRDNKIYFDDTKFISEEEHKELYKRCNPEKGDVLVTKSGTIGRTAVIKDDNEFSLFVSVALIKNKKNIILSEFLACAMRDYINKINISNDIKGGVIKNYHISDMKEQKIPLPPLEEQKRIVDKLDSFFDKIQKIKDIIQDVKEKNTLRKESILSKAFSGELTAKWRVNNFYDAKELLDKINEEKISNWELECKKAEEEGRKKPSKPKLKSIDEMQIPNDEIPYKIPDNWVWTRLENISEKITDGAHKTPTYVKEGVPFISVKDIRNNEIFFEDTKFISLEEHKELYKRCNPEKGDVLVTKSGTIGRTAVVKDDIEFSLFVSVALIKNIKNIINSNFLSYAMQDFINKIDVSRDIKGGVIKNYHISDMKKQLVPLPPLEEQKEIVKILDNIFSKENTISELISLEDKIQVLEKSILDKAFRGELGTHSPNDIDAHEILKNL